MPIVNGMFPERSVEAFSRAELGSLFKSFRSFLSRKAPNIDIGSGVSIRGGGYHIKFGFKNQNDLFKNFFKDGEFLITPTLGGEGLIKVFLQYHKGNRVYLGEFLIEKLEDSEWGFEVVKE